MLWKCLYGNNVWAHFYDELAGLNKDFRKMITEHADLKALIVKDIHRIEPVRMLQILVSIEDGSVI